MDELPNLPGLRIHALDRARVQISFPYHPDTVARIKRIPGRRWHPKEKSWSVPRTAATLNLLREMFGSDLSHTPGHPEAPTSQRAVSIPEADRQHGSTSSTKNQHIALRQRDDKPRRSRRRRPSPQEGAFLDPAREEMVLRGFSPATRKCYRHHLCAYYSYCEEKPAEVSAEPSMRGYLLHLIEKKQVSRSYLNQAISALKLYAAHVLRRPVDIQKLPRPRPEHRLPNILSRNEILRLFAALENPKHRALLMVAYSGGLRVSEVVRLRTDDIDPQRGLIHIRGGKGRKDRYIPLSRVLLHALQALWDLRTPSKWLFPGSRAGRHLSTRTVQKVFAVARRRAGISKHVTPHSLRHAYATHMLEDGTDLRYVQHLLGHKRPETTMIYTAVMERDVVRLRSPLDNIISEQQERPER